MSSTSVSTLFAPRRRAHSSQFYFSHIRGIYRPPRRLRTRTLFDAASRHAIKAAVTKRPGSNPEILAAVYKARAKPPTLFVLEEASARMTGTAPNITPVSDLKLI
jgi:hypothetical protein